MSEEDPNIDERSSATDVSKDSREQRSYRFDATKRVKHQRDFDAVYRFRARAYNERMTVCCRPTQKDAPARLGLSVSKKVGKAYVRNRWKRLAREAFRLSYYEIAQGFDYIVIPKKQERVPTYAIIASDLKELMKRAVKRANKNLERDQKTEKETLEQVNKIETSAK